MAFNYDAIPQELRWLRSWCVAGLDDKGTYKAPYGIHGNTIYHAKSTDPTTWTDFESCSELAQACPPHGIGFVLSPNDTFTVIDLDVKNASNEPDPSLWTSQEQIDRYWSIVQHFDSYTESSSSGQGLHIWVRGNIGKGCKRDGVEVYSTDRFIVCTGNIVLNKEIAERQELLEILVAEISNKEASKISLKDVDQVEDDETILQRANDAENGAKYRWLYEGNWKGEYKSQSEADLALMSIYTFYTKSNIQCRRLFRKSGLGKREKATKDDVALNRILVVIRSRQADDDAAEEAAIAASSEFAQRMLQAKAAKQLTAQPIPLAVPEQSAVALPIPVSLPAPPAQQLSDLETSVGIQWPPGMVGELAKYIFNSSPRPVKEISIVAALGLIAGICGKSYSIPKSGLNIYLILVGRSGVGKEAMHSGIAEIMAHVRNAIPMGMNFVDFTDYASGPALSKAVAANPSFLNVFSEWGRKLQRLATEDRDGPMQQLRTIMTGLYQKSGPQSIVGGIGYSDKDKAVASVSGVAYSMIGESTPRKFYDSLTEGMMEDGFLSRFTIIEYAGERPEANPNPNNTMDQFLKEGFLAMVAHSLKLIQNFQTVEIPRTAEADAALRAFDKECDGEIRRTKDEGWRQMWNRAHLKVFRIAGLLSAADNFINPAIQEYHVAWALDVVRRDIAIMTRRMADGDIGIGDASRENKLIAMMHTYLTNKPAASLGISPEMHADFVIPRKLLQIGTQKISSFTSHKNGQIFALDTSIMSLINSGYIVEVEKTKLMEKYKFHGKSYRILNLPLSDNEPKN